MWKLKCNLYIWDMFKYRRWADEHRFSQNCTTEKWLAILLQCWRLKEDDHKLPFHQTWGYSVLLVRMPVIFHKSFILLAKDCKTREMKKTPKNSMEKNLFKSILTLQMFRTASDESSHDAARKCSSSKLSGREKVNDKRITNVSQIGNK